MRPEFTSGTDPLASSPRATGKVTSGREGSRSEEGCPAVRPTRRFTSRGSRGSVGDGTPCGIFWPHVKPASSGGVGHADSVPLAGVLVKLGDELLWDCMLDILILVGLARDDNVEL
mmetsp:Transcript_33466/g.75698  ORF Transcript_33466/g.75698 Transcript_33466/m.75698 type:complete len:116 (+) Transcript_33466:653-1000(+)